jgi:hypothetical protein
MHLYDIKFQFGNTCYANSVIQALYFCKPFREKILNYRQIHKKSGKLHFYMKRHYQLHINQESKRKIC